eukprot:scaffold132113_cov33-Phaeocystis_antarctica.AAC.1
MAFGYYNYVTIVYVCTRRWLQPHVGEAATLCVSGTLCAHRYVTVVYFVSEPAAYHLSELIEDHAFYTYDNYLKVTSPDPDPDVNP